MAKRSALTKNPSATPVGRDMVYTGGSKDFNEVTGKYGSSGRAAPAPTRLSPGVYRDSQGRLVGQGGRPLQQQPQRPPMQQQPPRPIEWSPQQPGQQGKGPARDVYTPLPQPPMGLKPLQPDYTGGTGDYNYMPSMPGNMGRGAYAMQPDTMYLGGSANFDESTGRYRSGYVPPDRGMGGGMGTGLGNLAARGVNGGNAVREDFNPAREAYVKQNLQEMEQLRQQRPPGAELGNLAAGGVGGWDMVGQPLNNMGGGMSMVDPRTRVGPQYDPRSIALPANNPNGMGGGKFGLADSIAAQVKARMAGNAAGRMGQNLGNYQPGNIVPYNANRRR